MLCHVKEHHDLYIITHVICKVGGGATAASSTAVCYDAYSPGPNQQGQG